MSGHVPLPAGTAPPAPMHLMLVTDTSIVRGHVLTRQHRLSDTLNDSERPFVVLQQVEMVDVVGPGRTVQAAYAQVNLDAVLFAVTSVPVAPIPELTTPKAPQRAFITVPPYLVVGNIHLGAGDALREGLGKLVGRFLPVTDAVYWSDALGVDRTDALMVAVNHARAQILVPFEEIVPVDDIRRRIGALSGYDSLESAARVSLPPDRQARDR
jgi:hypothetical protein